MENLVMSKEKLPEMLTEIASKYALFGPIEENGFTSFKQISNSQEINLDYLLSRISPKSLIFQQTETLFTFSKGKEVKVNTLKTDEAKRVIFGIRPCDARGYSILDPVFEGKKEGDYKDPFYTKKRNRSTLIGLSCNKPDVNCFCTSFDDSPASMKNVDILFTDIGEKYLIDIVTEKGKELIENLSNLFSKASEEDGELRKKVEQDAIDTITRHMNTEGVVEKLDKMFDHELWQKTAMRCVGCGICTFLCPTCHCFDMQDEATLKEGARIRVWDSCMYPEYTMHASGHNPRPARMNRVRNRIYHKFNYFPKNDKIFACTGCGRCIDYCPVNIDIIDVIAKVKEVKI